MEKKMSTSVAVLQKETATVKKTARINLNLSEKAREEVSELVEGTNRSITELVRLGLSLVKLLFEEHRLGNKLIVTDKEGKPLKELVFPGI